jgi:hypothetical protein
MRRISSNSSTERLPAKDEEEVPTPQSDRVTPVYCAQCSPTLLIDFMKMGLTNQKVRKRLQILEGSICPLCKFFDTVVHSLETSLAVSRTAEFSLVTDSRRLALRGVTALEILGYESSQERFLLSLRPGTANPQMPYVPLDPEKINFDMITTWIKQCREEHTDVCSEPRPELPISCSTSSSIRVIDCLERRIVTLPSGSGYLALSYVWGQAQDVEKEAASQRSHPVGILPAILPKTIQDAMIVTLRLGFRFIWIDKYCIDQDTTEHEIMAQLASMDMIYQGALVTIVAAAGNDAAFGLPGVSDRHRLGHPSFTINGRTWYSGFRDIYAPVLSSKWNTRGWTYQEAHFSSRLLIFTSEQVLFECRTGNRCEAMAQEFVDHSHDIFGHRPGESRSLLSFSKHIELYSQRSLTNDSDALNAMRGLFASFSRAKEPIQQYWGLPLSMAGYGVSPISSSKIHHQSLSHVALAHGLLWDTTSKFRLERRQQFPSWSWAGWKAPVKWPGNVANQSEEPYRATFSAVRQDRTAEVLTTELAKRIFEDKNNNTSLYTFDLRIEAEVLQPNFYMRSGDLMFARAIVGNPSSNSTECYWLVDSTLATIYPDHNHLLKGGCFSCIVLNNVYGLVVGMRKGHTERFGRIKLQGQIAGPTLMSGPELIKNSPLRTHFPGSRQAIVLG